MARGASHYETLTARDLSRRQKEVLDLVAAGRTNGEIAERLGISLDGAKWHVSEILGKLGVASREEAANWWRGQRTVGSRFASFARAFAPLWTWKFGGPVLAAGGVAGAIALGIFLFQDGDDDAPPAQCTVDDVILETVEAFGPNGPGKGVFIALTARSRGTDCTFKGDAAAVWEASSPGGSTEPDRAKTLLADLNNFFNNSESGGPASELVASVDTIVNQDRTPLAYATLNNWCSNELRLAVTGALRHEGESSPFVTAGPNFVVERPPCDPNPSVASFAWDIMPAPLSSFLPDLGPDPLDFVFCYPSDPNELARWLRACQASELLHSPGVSAGSVAEVLRRIETREYICPAPGNGGLGGPWPLCDGAREGEVRRGIPVALHGSHGGAHSVEQLGERLLAMIETARDGQLFRTRVATVACLDEGCTKFALGIANDGSPAAAYLVFEPRGEGFAITNAGFAGDVALIIRRGGEFGSMQDESGAPAQWRPLVPPY